MSEQHPIPTHRLFKNLQGQRFGRWLVINYAGKVGRRFFWKCRCDCGGLGTVVSYCLTMGSSRSCGCLRVQLSAERRTTHGQSNSSLHRIWKSINGRCHRPSAPRYADYGGRGITVCDRWRHSFKEFSADMGPRPPGMTLDRRDNNKGYSPENCRWTTQTEQCRNTRRNLMIEFGGITKPLVVWTEELNLNYGTVSSRLQRGWPVERALSTPAAPYQKRDRSAVA